MNPILGEREREEEEEEEEESMINSTTTTKERKNRETRQRPKKEKMHLLMCLFNRWQYSKSNMKVQTESCKSIIVAKNYLWRQSYDKEQHQQESDSDQTWRVCSKMVYQRLIYKLLK